MLERLRSRIPRLWSLGIPILAGLCVIVAIALGVLYFQQQHTQTDIDREIPLKSRIVESFRLRADSFQKELDNAEAETAAAKAQLPTALRNEDVWRVLLSLGEEAGLSPTITPGQAKDVKIDTVSYQVLPYTVAVEGSDTAVSEFITIIDQTQQDLPTMVLQGISISTTGSLTRATLDVAIYVKKA